MMMEPDEYTVQVLPRAVFEITGEEMETVSLTSLVKNDIDEWRKTFENQRLPYRHEVEKQVNYYMAKHLGEHLGHGLLSNDVKLPALDLTFSDLTVYRMKCLYDIIEAHDCAPDPVGKAKITKKTRSTQTRPVNLMLFNNKE